MYINEQQNDSRDNVLTYLFAHVPYSVFGLLFGAAVINFISIFQNTMLLYNYDEVSITNF